MLTNGKLTTYRRGDAPLPQRYQLLPLYGQGFENLGPPVEVPMPAYGPDQLLVRHDACGICYSDIKVIRAGSSHPRLFERDLRENPVVLGHEVTLTVVGVGEALRQDFAVGQRFAVQAEVYHQGRNLAYGYMLQGGMSQYSVLGDEVLRGDDGCYLIPVRPTTGYAQAALTEPWACVEAAYNIHYRLGLAPRGITWIIGTHAPPDRVFHISQGLDRMAHPAVVVLTDVPADLAGRLNERAANLGVEIIERNGITPDQYGAALSDIVTCGTGTGEGVDDVVLLGLAPGDAIASAFCTLARGGMLNLVSDAPFPEPAHVDTGWLHYDHMTIVGNPTPDIAASYRSIRSKLRAGGRLWLLGAAGPMGHMHVQRAIEVGPRPSRIVATNRSSSRIAAVGERFGAAAAACDIDLVCLTQEDFAPQEFEQRLWELTGGEGFDDIVILAPSVASMELGSRMLARGGVMNLFAGLKRGTDALLDLGPIVDRRQVRYVGSSGSSIKHMTRMLELTEQGLLSTQRSVAAVTGLSGAPDGLRAVSQGTFPGKVVIYPHIGDLGLTPLSELKDKLPSVYAKLADGEVWTNAAEDELLRLLLK
jgi:threonine dehydrogenase-like Zn-dependent dehydrogenase